VCGAPSLLGPSTSYVVSMSARPTALKRYRELATLLDLDLAYLCIRKGQSAADVCSALRGLL